MTRDDALASLATYAKDRYPSADTVLLCGSTAAGTATANSDLDVVVIFEHLPDGAWRETVDADGTLVEAFVHDPATMRWFFEEDANDGQKTLATMVAEGIPVAGFPGRLAARARDAAHARIEAGPPRWPKATLDLQRYLISDLLDDIVPDMPATERIAVAATLHDRLATFALRAAGRFSGNGKGLARALARYDPALANLVAAAIEQLVRTGDGAPAAQAVDVVLAPYGGRLVAGYRAQAPADWRTDE